jgi:hypothetical protein
MAFAVEPGLVKTGIMRQSGDLARFLNYLLLLPILKTVEQGVSSTMYCLVADDLKAGGFFEDCSRCAAVEACQNQDEIRRVEVAFRKLVELK